jgi:collagen triple helix repeat protein
MPHGVTVNDANEAENTFFSRHRHTNRPTLEEISTDEAGNLLFKGETAGITGPQGAQGIPGNDGADGAQGLPGNDGADGAQGLPGNDGADGAQGLPGNDGADGAQGLPGNDGADGAQGLPGNDGADGAQGLPGNDGADGAQGLPGNDGAQGIPGNDGNDGAQGLPGNDGADGAQGLPGNDGADGAQGLPGNDGADGAQGLPGNDGADGAQGLPGNDGADGAQGIQGIQGEPGADGSGLTTNLETLAANKTLSISDASIQILLCNADYGITLPPVFADGYFRLTNHENSTNSLTINNPAEVGYELTDTSPAGAMEPFTSAYITKYFYSATDSPRNTHNVYKSISGKYMSFSNYGSWVVGDSLANNDEEMSMHADGSGTDPGTNWYNMMDGTASCAAINMGVLEAGNSIAVASDGSIWGLSELLPTQKASTAESEAGINDKKFTTPVGVKASIDKNAVIAVTETVGDIGGSLNILGANVVMGTSENRHLYFYLNDVFSFSFMTTGLFSFGSTGKINISGNYTDGNNCANGSIAIGNGACSSSGGSNSEAVHIGRSSGRVCTGDYNVTLGSLSGYNLTTGDHNVVIGYYAGYTSLAGQDYVTLLGDKCFFNHSVTLNNYDVYIGHENNFIIHGNSAANYLVQSLPETSPADGQLWNNSQTFYVDETNNNLMVKVKYSDGTIKTGTVCTLT